MNMNEELEKIAQDMRRKERELWAGNPPRMGNGAVALMLDGYASRLEVALGLAPRPKCEAARKWETGNAAAMREACRMLNDDGDDTLCEKLKCLWHGEPNGCNSPSGEYQTTAKLSGFGNAVAMHSCLVKILAEMLDFCGMEVGRKACFSPDGVAEEIRAALAVPPRNCDRFATPAEAHIAFQRFCRGNYRPGYAAAGLDGCDDCEFCEAKNERGEDACPFLWLFAPAEGGAE